MKDIGSVFERDHRCATTVIKYRNCIVDFGPLKSVHYPELNACFLKKHLDCNAIHFGYAFPVSLLPLDDRPDFVEVVLDGIIDNPVDPYAAAYLLQNRSEFEGKRNEVDPIITLEDDAIAELQNNFRIFTEQFIQNDDTKGKEMKKKMATTAKHDHVRSFTEPEEDIAAIAKQISDHAEAIYQTWKSRGLAPTEILTCHTNDTATDKFGSTLTPKTKSGMGFAKQNVPAQPDILADANKLEKLVNNFVVEDKARLAANKTTVKPVLKSNAVQYALQKFEKQSNGNGANRAMGLKPMGTDYSYRTLPQPTQISRPVPANQIRLQSLDTIEMILPEEVVQKSSPAPQKRIAGSVEFNGSNSESTGLTTWPLKNKTISQNNMKMRKDSLKTSPKNSDEYLSEVQREEERLINALKCGMIINEESSDKDRVDGKVQVSGRQENTITPTTALKKAVVNAMNGEVTKMRTIDGNQYRNTTPETVVQKIPGSNQTISIVKSRFESSSVKKVQEVKEWVSKEDSDKIKVKGIAKNRHMGSENVPHPELTNQQKQHIRQVGTNPVRPFLTRGSVAERVLIFEKCPTELLLDKRRSTSGVGVCRSGIDVQSKAQTYGKEKEKENQRPSLPLHTTLQRQTKSNKNVFIPRFYYPQGKPQNQQQIDSVLQRVASEFRTFPMGQVPPDKFHIIVKSCECPLYWKIPLFLAAGGEKLGYLDAHTFLDYWKQVATTCHDSASKFLRILVRNEARNFLLPEDFIPLIQDVVDTHPGLVFLKEANEFHSRYIHTVIARIFYCVNRSWSGRITLPELRRSNLLQIISLLEEEEDINQITQYFSYEHFYVIYCKFWELDRDHDLFIDRQDLTRHNGHALSSRMIDRIFSGAVTRGSTNKANQDKMSYTEFVWFLLSEEDKQHPTAIEYWFRCMDLDGDGYLSMYELEYFYEEQLQRMELLGIATLPFEDCLCQMLDMIHPQTEGKISLADLKKCKMVTIFFDTFFNLDKYLDHEQRDPFASQRDHDSDGEMSDWDRYAAEEYEILVAEEEGNDHGDDLSYDSDGMSDCGIPSLEQRLMKTFEGVERIQLPYPGNPQTITVNSEVSLSQLFGTDIETNGNGSVRIKLPVSSGATTTSASAAATTPVATTERSGNLFNGTWDATPKIKLTKCEDGSCRPEMDSRIASA